MLGDTRPGVTDEYNHCPSVGLGQDLLLRGTIYYLQVDVSTGQAFQANLPRRKGAQIN